jgi:hypothetical protein
MATIEVRVAGRGRVRDGEAANDAATDARCDCCGESTDAVVSAGPNAGAPFLCKTCLRKRLEASTIALFLLDQPSGRGLPWGKISG